MWQVLMELLFGWEMVIGGWGDPIEPFGNPYGVMGDGDFSTTSSGEEGGEVVEGLVVVFKLLTEG